MNCVLFSPVSDRDPCSADRTFRDVYRDGALLHIVRHYRPHKVYLFLTKRFREFEEKDHRYSCMLRHIMPEVDIHFLYCPETIQNAALFDQFDAPFGEYLKTIHEQNPEDHLLVNVSSGTPQMQASLYLLVATLPFQLKAVQVLSPNRDSNAGRDFYNPELAGQNLGEDGGVVRCTEDGQAVDFTEKRCRDVSCKNALRALLVKSISRLVDGDDYTAAQELYKTSKEHFTPKLSQLLRLAYAHLNLNEPEAEKLKNEGVDWLGFYGPVLQQRPEIVRRCYDYLLYLDSLVRRKALNDYSRALSPALTVIMRMCLENAGYNIMQFCEKDKNGVIKLKNYLIRRQDPQFMDYLNMQYYGSFKDGPLSAIQMLHYMMYLKEKKGIDLDADVFEGLRTAEMTIRNFAAHEMQGVTADDINRATHSSAKNILETLKRQYEKANRFSVPLKWDSLSKLKEQIKAELDILPE